MPDFEKIGSNAETPEQKDRKIYKDHIKAGVEFALAKIHQEEFDLQQAVYQATQALRLPSRDAFRRVRTWTEKDVRKELRAMRESEVLQEVFHELDTNEQLKDLAEHEAMNITEEERMDAEEE